MKDVKVIVMYLTSAMTTVERIFERQIIKNRYSASVHCLKTTFIMFVLGYKCAYNNVYHKYDNCLEPSRELIKSRLFTISAIVMNYGHKLVS